MKPGYAIAPDNAASFPVDDVGDVPDGYTFSETPLTPGYAVKNDGTYWSSVNDISEVPEGYYFSHTEPAPVVPAPPTPAENAARRDELLTLAAIRIAPLQDAVDLDEATAAEVALLKKWKQYRVALNRIDLTNPVWPTEP